MHPTTRAALRLLAFVWLCVLLAVLAGCGGGGDEPCAEDPPPPNTQPVDCHARPELCQ